MSSSERCWLNPASPTTVPPLLDEATPPELDGLFSLPLLPPAMLTGDILSNSAWFRDLTSKYVPIANCCSC